MKEIISNVEKVVDAMYPTQTSLILFNGFKTAYDVTAESEMFCFNSNKIEIVEGEEVITYLRGHQKRMNKTELNTLRESLTIDATTYTGVRDEEILKGAKTVIALDGIYGLTSEELDIR